MRIHRTLRAAASLLVCAMPVLPVDAAESAKRPNIVLILADDLGVGDVACYNAESKVATPNMDRLAADGMRFTNAYSAASVCVPSRYSLLTGRYPFRGHPLNWTAQPTIPEGQATIASLLKSRSYTTACVGKWHCGFDGGVTTHADKPMTGGPLDRGFDQFFGQHGSLDQPPYFYIRDRRAVQAATEPIAESHEEGLSIIYQGRFWREGEVAPNFKHEEVLDRYADEALKFLHEHHDDAARRDQPFFLYFALTAPHGPWLPGKAFQGQSDAGPLGDFVMHVDHAVGRVLKTLDELGQRDNTLVLLTSDNGPLWFDPDVEKYGHDSSGGFRGRKGDIWEGGIRMPLIARWPGKIPKGSTSDEICGLVDLLVTLTAAAGGELPAGAGVDSYNLLPALLGEQLEQPIRDSIVLQSLGPNDLAIREGKWKLIPWLGSGGFLTKPARIKPAANDPAGQLYNLDDDPGEQHNLYEKHPEIVARLSEKLATFKASEQTRTETAVLDRTLQVGAAGTDTRAAIVVCDLLPSLTGLQLQADDRLVGHWKLAGDARDSSGHRRHAKDRNVKFDAAGPAGKADSAAVFDGVKSALEITSDLAPKLGAGEFTISVHVHTSESLDDLPGEIISQYDERTRTGFRLGIDSRPGVTSSQANTRNLHFGIDSGSPPGEWTDLGRLGNAVLVFGMTVFDGQLFAGTCEAGKEEAGRVFRFDGQQWHDCGAPDRCNSVSSLAVHDGKLYVATSKYRLAGSSLPESENPHDGGQIFRYDGDNRWDACGTLPDVQAINGLVSFAGRLYAGSLYAPAGFFRYEGGTEWQSLGVPDGKRVESLGVHNGHVYATGYDEGAVYRFAGRDWEHLGVIDGANQTYGCATYGGQLYVSEWPNAKVFRYGGGTTWIPAGRLGDEKETMPLVVYNGKLYAGTLPSAEVYRYDGPADPGDTETKPAWTKIARLDFTPDVRYRRVWSMAVYRGRLFAGTLPSGRVHSIEIGRNASHDRELAAGWHHIAAVRETDRLRLYVDGELVGSSSEFGAGDFDLTNERPLRVGFGTTDHFNGRMSDLRIYDAALSAAEIRQLSNH